MTSTFQSPFLSAIARPRTKGFAETVLDDLTSISGKQALALPLTIPLHAGAGAIEGLSFGLLSPTDELEQMLGEYAPPAPIQNAAEIAGTIGGSFVPYIGASRVASGIFQGIGLGQRIARGAFTFGAPEVIRQGLAQELDPAHAGRALATGAAFSLPLPRIRLAPVVAGTELMLGATPLEAGVSAGFAALFGPIEKIKRAAAPTGPTARQLVGLDAEGLLGSLVKGAKAPKPFTRTTGTPFIPRDLPVPKRPETEPYRLDVDINATPEQTAFKTELIHRFPTLYHGANLEGTEAIQRNKALGSDVFDTFLTHSRRVAEMYAQKTRGKVFSVRTADVPAELLEDFDRTAIALPAKYGNIPLRNTVSQQGTPTRSQVELILEIAGKADLPEARVSLRQLAMNVEALADKPEESIANALVKAIDLWGPDAPQTKGLQFALAQKRGGFVPPGAATVNPLKPPVAGIELITPGPTNPFEMRAMHEEMLSSLRASGGTVGHTKAAHLEEVVYEARQEAARMKARGQVMTPQRMAEIQAQQDKIMSSELVTFQDDNEAFQSVLSEMSKTTRAADVDAFVSRLPEYYQREPGFIERVKQAAESRKQVITRVIEPVLKAPEKTPEFARVEKAVSDYGASASLEEGQVVLRHAGQDVRKFKTPQEVEAWTQTLEDPTSVIRNIHEMRMLAHSRGMVVDFDGRALNVTNQLTGETLRGLGSLQEAAEAVRSAPNVAVAAREIGPQVPGAPTLPGAGSLHGLGSEQPPPFCPLQLP